MQLAMIYKWPPGFLELHLLCFTIQVILVRALRGKADTYMYHAKYILLLILSGLWKSGSWAQGLANGRIKCPPAI